MRDMPSCFRAMTRAFDQDCLLEAHSLEDLAEGALVFVSPNERAELAAHLDRLLAAGPAACKNAWKRSEADIAFRRVKDVVTLLEAIRARLRAMAVDPPP